MLTIDLRAVWLVVAVLSSAATQLQAAAPVDSPATATVMDGALVVATSVFASLADASRSQGRPHATKTRRLRVVLDRPSVAARSVVVFDGRAVVQPRGVGGHSILPTVLRL